MFALSRTVRAAVALVVVVAGAASCSSSAKTVGVPNNPKFSNPVYGDAAALTGPVTVGHIVEPESGQPLDLPVGYVEQEFFASGSASAFTAATTPSNGRWTITPASSASYKTRLVVRRPTSAGQFNGTVVVEWLNVSAGESSPDWDYLNPYLTAAGYAYVGVSAQALGVDGGKALLGTGSTGSSGGLVGAEPARYGSLHHPGDRYSYDIFAQIARALRTDQNPSVLGGLPVRRIVAVGESQSAFFLTTFANAIQPETQSFDGIFIHSRGAAGAPLDGSSVQGALTSSGEQIRTDSSLGCPKPINDGPQHPVVQAAFAAFDKWVADRTPPPTAAPLRLAGTHPVRLALDADGNAIGGVRTPAVDVPISTLSGVAPPGASTLCSLFGSSTPFSQARLAQMYGSSAGYLSRYRASLQRAVSAGFILPADRAELLQKAEQVQIP